MNFAATKCANWTPSKFSAICSKHFVPDDYDKYLVEIPGTRDYTPQLKKHETGIVVFPTKFKRSNLEDEASPCDKHQVCLLVLVFCWSIQVCCV